MLSQLYLKNDITIIFGRNIIFKLKKDKPKSLHSLPFREIYLSNIKLK